MPLTGKPAVSRKTQENRRTRLIRVQPLLQLLVLLLQGLLLYLLLLMLLPLRLLLQAWGCCTPGTCRQTEAPGQYEKTRRNKRDTANGRQRALLLPLLQEERDVGAAAAADRKSRSSGVERHRIKAPKGLHQGDGAVSPYTWNNDKMLLLVLLLLLPLLLLLRLLVG